MTDEEIIAVVQAHKEGKRIQIRRRSSDEIKSDYGWKSGDPLRWNFIECEYRVAPEPHWIDGYVFPKDVHEKPTIGMIKMNQVKLSSGENPVAPEPRKPREWRVYVASDGLISSDVLHQPDAILVREVIK